MKVTEKRREKEREGGRRKTHTGRDQQKDRRQRQERSLSNFVTMVNL